MAKISIQDLKKIKERERTKMALRQGEFRAKITVHMGTCGIAAGARDILSTFREVMADRDIVDVLLTNSGCAGLCGKEPMITVEVAGEEPVKYTLLTRDKVLRVFNEHVMGGKAVEDYALPPERKNQAAGNKDN